MGLESAGIRTTCVNMKETEADSLSSYDFIAIGTPTQAFSASKTTKDFLKKLEEVDGLNGKCGFAFDTKLKSRLAGSGGKFIEKKLTELGINVIRPHSSAIVEGKEGPLEHGEDLTFEQIGLEIGRKLYRRNALSAS